MPLHMPPCQFGLCSSRSEPALDLKLSDTERRAPRGHKHSTGLSHSACFVLRVAGGGPSRSLAFPTLLAAIRLASSASEGRTIESICKG